MRLLLCLSLLLPGAALCLAEESPLPDSDEPVVTIYTQFQVSPPANLVQALRAEVAEVLKPVGIDFQWRSLDDPRASEPVSELVVIKFKGRCESVEGSSGAVRTGALGWTHISDGDMLPFSDIDCDRTWRFIRPELAGAEEEQRDRVFGRALGRVLAHELYHIFANTTKHAGNGVAKACYSSSELVSERFHFQEKEFRMIRQGKLRNLLSRKHTVVADADGGGQ